jgi:membrane protease YdiL (CAAX protease family)
MGESALNLPQLPGVVFLLFMLLMVPYGALRSRHQIYLIAPMPRDRYFRSVVLQQLAFLGIALVVGYAEIIPLPMGRLDLLTIGAAIALSALGLAVMRTQWRRKIRNRDARLALFVPRTRSERLWWTAVSVVAGISEELVWRGVLIALLWRVTDSWLAAAILSSTAFGVSHAVQGKHSAVIIGAMAMVMAAFVHWSGGLFLAMAMHAGYDLAAGFGYARLMDEAGIVDTRLDGSPRTYGPAGPTTTPGN